MVLPGPRGAKPPAALRALWAGVIPVGFAVLFVRFAFPDRVSSDAGPAMRAIAHAAHEHALAVAMGLFVLFAALAGYWRRLVPGARWLAPPVAAENAPRSTTRRARDLVILVLPVALAAGAALTLRAAVLESYHVVSASMVPTLEPGDRVLVDKRAYGFRVPFAAGPVAGTQPRRGDVIVFRAAGTINADGDAEAGPGALVKRVIALPGEHVTMIDSHPVIDGRQMRSCDAGSFVYFSGRQTTRGRLAVEFPAPTGTEGAYLTVQEPGTPRSFAGYTVKPGEVFVLGDNRGSSNDSRSWGNGRGAGVPLSLIAGRARRIAFGTTRADHVDGDRVGRAVGLGVRLDGFNIAPLRAGIARCLSNQTLSGRGD